MHSSSRARPERNGSAVQAVHRVVEQVDTWVEGAEAAEGIESAIGGLPVPMIVFNPHSWQATASVSLPHPVAAATDAGGRRVRVQQIPSGEVTYSPTRSLLRVSVPAFGYRRYWLHVVDPASGVGEAGPEPATATGDGILANGLLRVQRGHGHGPAGPPGGGRHGRARRDRTARRGRAAGGRRRRQRHVVPRRRSLHRRRGGGPPPLGPRRRDRARPRHRAQHLVVRRRADHRGAGRPPQRGRRLGRGPPRCRLARGPSRAETRRPRRTGATGQRRRRGLRIDRAPVHGPRRAHGPLGRPLRQRGGLGPHLHRRGVRRLRRPGADTPPHGPAQPAGGRSRAGVGCRRPRRLPGHGPGAPPPSLSPRAPSGTGPCGTAAAAGRRAPDRVAGRARHLAPGAARARGLGGAHRGRKGDHAGAQARRGRRRQRGPPVGGRRPGTSTSASPWPRAGRGLSRSGRASSGPTRYVRSSSPTTIRQGPGRWASPSSTSTGRPVRLRAASSRAIRTCPASCPRWRLRSRF